MNNEERDLISKFVARVGGAQQGGFGSVPSTRPSLPPIDPEADQFIAQQFQQYPEARYRITQMAVVQEAALVEAQNRIQQLQFQLQQAQQAAQQAQQQQKSGSGFLGGLFGGGQQRPQQQAAREGATDAGCHRRHAVGRPVPIAVVPGEPAQQDRGLEGLVLPPGRWCLEDQRPGLSALVVQDGLRGQPCVTSSLPFLSFTPA
nr:DUF2076 family protein [Acetobacter orientalis]